MAKTRIQDAIRQRVDILNVSDATKRRVTSGVGRIAAAQKRYLPTEVQRREQLEQQIEEEHRAMFKSEIAERIREIQSIDEHTRFSSIARYLYGISKMFTGREHLKDGIRFHPVIKLTDSDTPDSLTGLTKERLEHLKYETTMRAYELWKQRLEAAHALEEGSKNRDHATVNAYITTVFPFSPWDNAIGSDWTPINDAFGIDSKTVGVSQDELKAGLRNDVIPAWMRLAEGHETRFDNKEYNINGCNFFSLVDFADASPREYGLSGGNLAIVQRMYDERHSGIEV